MDVRFTDHVVPFVVLTTVSYPIAKQVVVLAQLMPVRSCVVPDGARSCHVEPPFVVPCITPNAPEEKQVVALAQLSPNTSRDEGMV